MIRSFWPIAQYLASLLIFLAGASGPARADTLRILTSMPPSATEPFLKRFQDGKDDLDILILNKNTVSSVEELLRDKGSRFDIFWASSPEAFEVLGQQGVFNAGGVG